MSPAASSVDHLPVASGGDAMSEFGPDPIRTRPWELAPGQYDHLLRSLRFQYFKWDTYAVGANLILPESIVLARRAHEQIVDTVEAFSVALQRFESRVRSDPATLKRLGIPPELHQLIASEKLNTLQLTRCDLFPCEDGRWMISEFNEDVPGGFNEAMIPKLLGDPGQGFTWEGDLRASLLRAFRPYRSVGLLYATGFKEDLQHMLILEKWLREEGHRTVLGSTAHLEASRWGRPRVLGTKIDAAFRFFPGEWMAKLPNLDVWRRLGPTLPMMNPLHRLVRQSKTMFAMWREMDLPPEDRRLLDRHVPITKPFDATWRDRLRDERERWVLKRAFGRMGDAVSIGALLTPKEWDDSIAEAVASPSDFCVQERFVAVPLEFRAGPLYPAIGAFVVNGRFAGYYSRAAPRPLITHEALHVGTVVESA